MQVWIGYRGPTTTMTKLHYDAAHSLAGCAASWRCHLKSLTLRELGDVQTLAAQVRGRGSLRPGRRVHRQGEQFAAGRRKLGGETSPSGRDPWSGGKECVLLGKENSPLGWAISRWERGACRRDVSLAEGASTTRGGQTLSRATDLRRGMGTFSLS